MSESESDYSVLLNTELAKVRDRLLAKYGVDVLEENWVWKQLLSGSTNKAILHVPQPLQNPSTLAWESPEHQYLGDSLRIWDPVNDEFTNAGTFPRLRVERSGKTLDLTFGTVVALAGDFYGNPDTAICLDSKLDSFLWNLRTLYHAHVEEVQGLQTTIQEHNTEVSQAIQRGATPAKAFQDCADKYNSKYNIITGGGSNPVNPFTWGRYMKLAAYNIDHFGEDAIKVYVKGHFLAACVAWNASFTTDTTQKRKLVYDAYMIEAYACHFLSDLFSAGHMRVPRKALHDLNTFYFSILPFGDLCAKGMHDEDSAYGLRVSNRKGETWKAYGDSNYWAAANQENVDRCKRTLQASLDEIIRIAKGDGTAPHIDLPFEALNMIPDVKAAREHSTDRNNIAPLFVSPNGYDVQYRTGQPSQYVWSKVYMSFSDAVQIGVQCNSDEYKQQKQPQPPNLPQGSLAEIAGEKEPPSIFAGETTAFEAAPTYRIEKIVASVVLDTVKKILWKPAP